MTRCFYHCDNGLCHNRIAMKKEFCDKEFDEMPTCSGYKPTEPQKTKSPSQIYFNRIDLNIRCFGGYLTGIKNAFVISDDKMVTDVMDDILERFKEVFKDNIEPDEEEDPE